MIKKQFYLGFVGLFGLMSLKYFLSGDLLDLSYIGFFAFFSNFFIGKITGNREDERYIEDKKTALAFTGQLSIILLFIMWCFIMVIKNIELIIVLISLSYAVILNIYSIKLYTLEEK